MSKPSLGYGLRHLALFVVNFDACVAFYHTVLGMEIIWQPDADNVYLTSGSDNLALHRAKPGVEPSASQVLDHLGFVLASAEAVDQWYTYLQTVDVRIMMPPKTHRDGARSLYCQDPDKNAVQMIYLPYL